MLDFNIEPQQMPIGKSEIADALQTFNKYKAAKAEGDKRVIEAFDYYRLHQRDHMRATTIEEIQPASAWLHNVIQNKHADVMDNKPAPNILPREENDVEEAALLSKIIPCVLDQTGFNSVFRSWAYDLIIGGTGVFGVFWDGSALNGLGDIAVKNIDVINMFWEPGITDIQQSANVFVVEAVDNDVFEVEDWSELVVALCSEIVADGAEEGFLREIFRIEYLVPLFERLRLVVLEGTIGKGSQHHQLAEVALVEVAPRKSYYCGATGKRPQRTPSASLLYKTFFCHCRQRDEQQQKNR